ncbi:MAG TPA: energy transducer TonB [Planctomycetota bacterium]|nr:energy transducer TonB [Planctomycetota bacterium]
MKFGLILGIGAALFLHAGFLLFGGLIFHVPKPGTEAVQVELVSEEVAAEEKKKEEEKPPEPEATEELQSQTEEAPDAEELIRRMELSAASQAPKLDASSLSAIEDALNGTAAAASDFTQSLDFQSGSLSGTGKGGGALADTMEKAFSLDELDQKPRVVFQPAPNYPAALRGRRIEGVVSVFFLLDETGRVNAPRVEKSTNGAFDKPALDAVKNWKFEPGVKAGKRVPTPMRVQIRFPPS